MMRAFSLCSFLLLFAVGSAAAECVTTEAQMTLALESDGSLTGSTRLDAGGEHVRVQVVRLVDGEGRALLDLHVALEGDAEVRDWNVRTELEGQAAPHIAFSGETAAGRLTVTGAAAADAPVNVRIKSCGGAQ